MPTGFYVRTDEYRRIMREAKKGTIPKNGFKEGHMLSMGRRHPNWNGGRRTDKNGYVLIWNPSHPASNTRNYVWEHRLVMEKKLGRYLKSEEVVHHIDGNPSNNAKENLGLFPNSNEHLKFHRENKVLKEKAYRLHANGPKERHLELGVKVNQSQGEVADCLLKLCQPRAHSDPEMHLPSLSVGDMEAGSLLSLINQNPMVKQRVWEAW